MKPFWKLAGVVALTRGLQICYFSSAQNIVQFRHAAVGGS